MYWLIVFHPGEPLQPHDLWTAWNGEISLLLLLLILVLAYGWGVHTLWRSAGAGRGIQKRPVLAFAGAILALAVALISPLDALSAALFSAHMLQHLLLMLVAAPLLVLSRIPLALLWAFPRRWVRVSGQWVRQAEWRMQTAQMLASPILAWVLFSLALWVWHAPSIYQAALELEPVHALEHAMLLVTAVLFWSVPLSAVRRSPAHYARAIPFLFLTGLHSGVLGALMTFSAAPWYPYYAGRVSAWGLTLLQDQQLAGLFMWLPGGAVFTGLTIWFFSAWFRGIEQRSQN